MALGQAISFILIFKEDSMTHQNRLFILCSLLLFAVVPIALSVAGLSSEPIYDSTYLGELSKKTERLDSLNDKRLVVIGGSGVAFSINSPLLKQEFPLYEPVNFGLYAGLGSQAMMELALPSLHKDDLVILSFEQENQALSTYFNPTLMWEALDGHFALAERLNGAEKKALLSAYPSFASSKARHPEKFVPQGIYAQTSFNVYGDIETPLADYNHLSGLYDVNMPLSFEEDVISNSFVDAMNSFAQAANQKGASVYYRFPAMNSKALVAGSNVDSYFDFLQNKLHFRILGDPHKALMDPEWFYDTNFHCNQAGAVVNTVNLIKELKAERDIATATSIALPSKPLVPSSGTEVGDDRDARYFLAEEKDGGFAAISLTDEGKQQEELIVPSTIDSHAITQLSSTTFAGDTAIKKITIPSSLRTIEDAAFSGCDNLEKIVLTSSKPSSYSIGHHLLDGTKANLYVPSASLDAYLSDYFFATYSGRIFPIS
jgi:hypothetical protein